MMPQQPGCYLFKDAKGKVIYIGKAKNLKKRVSSYFNRTNLDPKTENLVKNIKSTDFIAVDNEKEALILENNLIKKYQPKYNIHLRDSKRYAYIQLTDEHFPKLQIARKKTKTGIFFGPFVSAVQRDYVLQTMIRTFKIRTCKKMPKKPCLRFHINLCDAPCIGNISEQEYINSVRLAKLALRGKTDPLIASLNRKMLKRSDSKEYETALEIRDRISALKKLSERQKMETEREYNEDVINYVIKEGKVYLMLFNIYKGTLFNKSEFVFDFLENCIEDFVGQYYSVNPTPKELLLPIKVPFYSRITVPKIGEKKKLLDLVKKNIELTFFGEIRKLEQLKIKLKLEDTPYVIECFDISHLGGTSTVGSMVQFRNAAPDKTNYRRFRIRTVHGIDDYKAIAEVVHRRYSRLKKEEPDILNPPNLIIIDGGKGQLSAALQELKKLGLKIPIISIAKRLEEIYFPGFSHPVRLAKKDIALQFIQQIRDEAHRFAIKYNRLLRIKGLKNKS